MTASTVTNLRRELRGLQPGGFALVMGTGIVSIATDLLGMRPVAVSMFWFNVGAYAVLWILTMARLIAYPGLVKRDLMDHRQGPGFFTAVAGTCVMGVSSSSSTRRIESPPSCGLSASCCGSACTRCPRTRSRRRWRN